MVERDGILSSVAKRAKVSQEITLTLGYNVFSLFVYMFISLNNECEH